MATRFYLELPILLMIIAGALAAVLLWVYLVSTKHTPRPPEYVV